MLMSCDLIPSEIRRMVGAAGSLYALWSIAARAIALGLRVDTQFMVLQHKVGIHFMAVCIAISYCSNK